MFVNLFVLGISTLLILIAIPIQISARKLPIGKELKLTILHTNDIHSRLLQTNKYSGPCPDNEAENGQCFGGFPRLHYKVSEIRRDNPNVAYLSGGDYYQGTMWYSRFKWELISKFVNILNHTAMTLGNHEFDDNMPGLVPFLERATFPIVSSNIDNTLEPSIQGKYKKSVVVSYEGVKVGIIGFTTRDTAVTSHPGQLKFKNEIESLKEETQRLHDLGVRILIGLGHSGYDVEKKVAEMVPLIDLVVGGHTHTFLYSGTPPTLEEVSFGPYPTIVTQPSGRKVPVVQAYAFGKYLGYLNVTFDADGEVKEWAGKPILLDSSIPQDPDLLEVLTTLGKNLTESLRKDVVGTTNVFLNGSGLECRMRECNLGNVITDAMVYADRHHCSNHSDWANVRIALISGGGIRSSIDEKSMNGSITREDLTTILPFGNRIDLVQIKGNHLKQAFEFSVDGYGRFQGKFLQASGVRVVYDLSQPVNSRVKSLQVLCRRCRVRRYEPINPEKIYKVAIQSYLADGGDGYNVLRNNIIARKNFGLLDLEVVAGFLKDKSPITTGIEGRITFYEPEENGLSQKFQIPSEITESALCPSPV